MSDAPFGRRRAAWLAAAAGISLALSAFLGVYGELLGEPASAGADAFSRSATGHRALVALLRSLGLQVLVSRHRTAEQARGDAVVALLEPAVEAEAPGARAGLLEGIGGAASQLLVVLPKRRGAPDPLQPGWLAHVELVEPAVALAPLLALSGEDALDRDLQATLVRPVTPATAWTGELPVPTLDQPQLLKSPVLRPLLATADGMLVGELAEEDWRVIVVSDPDLLETHGLGRGDNALLVVRLLERLGAGARPVVLDETLHGYDLQPSIARELLRFPLVLATLQAGLTALLLAWAALVRFGRPRRPAPLLRAGTGFLVESTAGLLQHGGHVGEAVEAAWRAARETILRRLGPRGAPGPDPERALARLAEARGRGAALAAVEARVRALRGRTRGHEAAALRAAREIHQFREELTDGAAADP